MTSTEKNESISKAALIKYANLAVQIGVNVQKNQLVIVHSDLEHAEFARFVQKAAYKAGASNVVMDWTDEETTKQQLVYATVETIADFQNGKSSVIKHGSIKEQLSSALFQKHPASITRCPHIV